MSFHFNFFFSFRYNEEAQGSWKHLSSAEYRDSYALSSLGDNLYLIGGQMMLKNQYLITNSVARWSLQGGPWRSAAPLPMPLAYHSVVRIKNCLYVLGGRTPQVRVISMILRFPTLTLYFISCIIYGCSWSTLA